MFTLKIKDKDYVIKFTTRTFAQSNLMERVETTFVEKNDTKALQNVANLLAELIYEGCKKFTPIESVDAAFDLIDDYVDEHKGEEDIVMNLVSKFADDLQEEGFMGDLLKTMTREMPEQKVSRSKKK